jgi:uncharacterized protein YndB with AHSA1/START domain
VTEEQAGTWTRASRVIKARPEELYEAFIDPAALLAWLPPAEMTGYIYEFDPGVGGGYRMSLFYPPNEHAFRGKTSDKEDMVDVRFVELAPPYKIIETVNFVTTDRAFRGEMMTTATFEEVPGGTEVTLVFKNLPPGLRAEDNEAGSRLSLEQLARRSNVSRTVRSTFSFQIRSKLDLESHLGCHRMVSIGACTVQRRSPTQVTLLLWLEQTLPNCTFNAISVDAGMSKISSPISFECSHSLSI